MIVLGLGKCLRVLADRGADSVKATDHPVLRAA